MNLVKKLPGPSLAFCISMDLIGYASFSIPVLAEMSDVIWAPISAFIFLKSFGGKIGKMGSVFNFFEEILPFTDFIPSFSIAWLFRNGISSRSGAKSLTPVIAGE